MLVSGNIPHAHPQLRATEAACPILYGGGTQQNRRSELRGSKQATNSMLGYQVIHAE
jgi:hypothetical protein